MDITPFIAPLVTAIIAAAGTYAAISSRLARLETMIADLRRDVEKHNRVIERTYILERDMKTAFNALDELKAKDEKLEDKLDGIRIGGTE